MTRLSAVYRTPCLILFALRWYYIFAITLLGLDYKHVSVVFSCLFAFFCFINDSDPEMTVFQLSSTVRIPIFWLADLYHVILGCDETTTLTSLSWCNSRGVNLTHHCRYTTASADSHLVVPLCSVFNLNNKNVNALIARELSGLTCTRSLTKNSKFSIPHEALPRAVLKFLVHC